MPNNDASRKDYAAMDATNPGPELSRDAQARARRIATVRFIALDEDCEPVATVEWWFPWPNGLAEVVERCIAEGEEARLFDATDNYLGCVCCDGSIEWGV